MSIFYFKEFSIRQEKAALKVGTDAMVLGAMVELENKKSGLDIGTGTGVLAMMMAQKNPLIRITAVEIDKDSCADARFNFENGPYSERLEIIEGDVLQMEARMQYDIIVTNPPFYTDALKSNHKRTNQAKHVEGLSANLLCQKVAELLTHDGDFWVIWPFESEAYFISTAFQCNLNLKKNSQIFGKTGIPIRSILCFSKKQIELPENTALTIRDLDGNYTEEYKKLTIDFHNKKL